MALFFFTVVAVIASNLAARVRGQALSARLRARQTDDLYQFSRKLAVAVTLDDLLWATAHQIALMLKVRVVLLLPEADKDHGSISVRAGFPPEDMLDEADLAAAKWSWEKNHIAGRGSDTLPGGKWLFQPLRTGRGPLGVVGIIRDEPGPLLTPDQQRLLDALADQAALAIERVNLARDLHRARLQVETDRLRSALLTSISHDLRTPLASILGSATSLRSQDAILDKPTKEALLGTIIEESDRLNRFIGNLLDMTRLESGALKPRTGLNELSDVIGSALQRALEDPVGAPDQGRSAARPADAGAGYGAVRAGAVQPAGQRRQTCADRQRNHHRRQPRWRYRHAAHHGRRRRHPRRRCRSHLRKILPRPARPTAGVPERDWVSRFAAGSWRPWAER